MSMNEQACTTESVGTPRVSYRGVVFQAILLMAVWLTLSGFFDLLHILYGVVSVALVVWINYRLHPLPLANCEACGTTRIILPRLIVYLFWLLWQIIKSGVYVAYVVLDPRMPIQPTLIRFDCLLPNVLARVIFGNSITLTPGTITANLQGDRFTVHALTQETADDLTTGEMSGRVARLYTNEYNPDDLCFNIQRTDSGSKS